MVSLRSHKTSLGRAARGLDRAKKEVGDLVQRLNRFRLAILCEAEAIVNRRPLTYVSSRLDEGVIITPAHFLQDHADLKDEMAASTRTLEQQREEFNRLLTEFERQAAEEDDNSYENDLQAWEDLVYESRQLYNKAGQLLDSFAATLSAAQTPTGSQRLLGEPSTFDESLNRRNLGEPSTFDESLNRIAALMERQQQQAAGTANQTTAEGSSAWAKLPKQELPKFSGEPLEWPEFWDHFDSSIGKNPKLAPVDKLSYLKGLLEGDARKLIKSLPMTNDSYAVAERTLKSRYEDKKLTVSLLYRKLSEMKPIKNEPAALKTFLAETECTLGSLEAQGQDIEDQNFVTIIMSKLPLEIVTTLEMFKAVSDPWTVKLLRDRLSEHMIRLDRAERASSNGSSRKSDRKIDGSADGLSAHEGKAKDKKKSKARGKKKDASPKARDSGSKPKPSFPCVFCDGDHWPTDCPKYATVKQRQEKLLERGRCLLCLKEGHIKRKCPSGKACFYCGKTKSHHSSLCNENERSKQKTGEPSNLAEDDAAKEDTADEEAGGPTLLAVNEQVTLQTAKACVAKSVAKTKGVETRILFDPGACRTYCSESLAKKLGLTLKPGPCLSVNRFGCDKPISMPTKLGRIEIRANDGTVHRIEASVIPQITGEVSRRPVKSAHLKSWSKKVKLADKMPTEHETVPVDLLVGSDYYLDFVTGEKIVVEEGLYLLGSVFGFILTGRSPTSDRAISGVSMCGYTCGNLSGLNDLVGLPKADPMVFKKPDLSDFWSLESIGIRDKVDGEEDEIAIESFQKGVKYENGRYSVPLPWKENATEMQTDYNLSIGRLRSLVKRLKGDDDLFKTYDDTISDQLKKGVIEKVKLSTEPGPIVHYIPHHAVVEPQKETTKVRVVYDGSAKSKPGCPSLNECLYRGPVLLEDLVGHLIRFRTHKIAIISDIEKAFLQIQINKDDRDALRFLWLKDPTEKSIDRNVQVYRFQRVLFGLNCSPSLLAQTVRYHLKQAGTPVALKVLDDLYVDNVISGVDTEEEAKEYYKEVKDLFRSAAMNMRQWTSNSEEFNEFVPVEDRVKFQHTKVLGILWERKEDKISINGGYHPRMPTTKRTMLSAISKVYDPLGLVSPITIAGKILLQKISKGKSSWDAVGRKEDLQQCEEHIGRLKEISKIAIPRKTPITGEITLIAFTDASSSSYATSIYLKCVDSDQAEINLLMCKSRVNPKDEMTVPKLELLGILIGTRALQFVKDQLRRPVDKQVLFCDSKCALFWVKSGKVTGVWCRNRVKQILDLSKETEFRYVNTDENPADWATRGKRADELTEFWWQGPNWLTKNEVDWPTWEFEPFVPSEVRLEPQPKPIHEASLVAKVVCHPPFGIQLERYSSLTNLLRITAWCFRALNAFKGFISSRRHLSADEIEIAEDRWERHVQREHFADVFEKIAEQKKHRLIAIGAFVDEDGTLRCRNRMSNAEMPWIERCPKVLPKRHPYVDMLIEDLHKKNGHASAAQVLNELKKYYWLPKGRSLVNKVTRKCVVCKKATGKPYAIPPMPELPGSRVVPNPSFTHTGIDYFGPVKVRGKLETGKAWICLFTCLTTRAVHLELVRDLSAEQFLLCMRRFIVRRGKPKTILSDNGPQFKVSSEVLSDPWAQVQLADDVMNFATTNGIEWTFIPSFAPYMGGVYERMVGVVKSSLRKMIGKALLTSEEFTTILCEAEAIVNRRPLTYVSSRLDEGVIITPAHFLNPYRETSVPDCSWKDETFESLSVTAENLVEKWKKGQNLLNQFWKIWSTEYLDQLRSRNTYLHRSNSRLPQLPAEGDLVLIKEGRMPRGSWRIGRIEALGVSPDGNVRSANVLLPSGRIISRPVTLLVPFEVSHEKSAAQSAEIDDESVDNGSSSVANPCTSQPQRPRREAASKAAKLIANQLGHSGN